MTISILFLRTVAFVFATLVVAASGLAKAQDTNAASGEWRLDQRWLQISAGGETLYGTTLVQSTTPQTYQICRVGLDRPGAGTNELRLLVNGSEIPSYSLDHGSCYIGRGNSFALRYAGANITANSGMYGTFARLDDDTLLARSYRRISRWSMNWDRNFTSQNPVRLVDGVQRDYRVCFNGTEAGPTQPGVPASVSARIRLDGGQYIRLSNQQTTYRQSNCVDVTASRIDVELASRSATLDFYHMTGALWVRSEIRQ